MKTTVVNLYLLLLKILAQAQLAKNKPLIIGITGSAGKSSCTQLVASSLSENFKIKYTKKGNSETGIPFEILNIPVKNYSFFDWPFTLLKGIYQVLFNWETFSILVAEMGIDSDQTPKDMDTLLKIISPDIGVLLNANSVHLGNFKGPKEVQTVANQKAKLLFSLPNNGLAILNIDQEEFLNFEEKIKATINTFSLSKKADLQLTKHQVSLKGSSFDFVFKAKEYQIVLKDKLVFKESFGSFASAFLIQIFLGLSPQQAILNIEKNFSILPGRGRVFKGIKESTIIDSSYNSSLEPTIASLKLLKEIKDNSSTKVNQRRTIAVLGDMRELGEKAQEDHQKLENIALKTADIIYTVGPLTSKYFINKNVRKYPNAFSVITDLKQEIRKNDIILVKGSQNTILLEIVVKEILKNKKDIAKLARQTPYWDKQRNKLRKEKTT